MGLTQNPPSFTFGEMDARSEILKIAFLWYGRPYVWGGDDPSGFDCSGFVIEVLQSVGIIADGMDYTAHGLYNLFNQFPRVGPAQPGDLVFWLTGTRATHIEIMVDETRSIGASGSGSPKFDLLSEISFLIDKIPSLESLFLKDGEIRPNLYTWAIKKALFQRQAERDNGYIKVRPVSRRPGFWIYDPISAMGG